MSFKLIAVDLDDTLLDSKCCISPRVKEAMKKARSQGVFVTFATGRMYASAVLYAQELGIDLPLITYQGALVKTSATGEVLLHKTIPLDLAREVIQEGEKVGLQTYIYLDDRLYVSVITPEVAAYEKMIRVQATAVGDLGHFLNQEPTKILYLWPEGDLSALWNRMTDLFGRRLYMTKSAPCYVEFTHPETSKGNGLRAVADYLGVKKEEIIVFGDSYNDLDLFRQAGFAVAMGNAWDEVKKAADYVTCSNDEDGVAEAIENLVLRSPHE
ncbi:Cof-type HAD-IIB family hydrolase [Candidatus Formimonas warabiya]|uniref:HAD family phosphatase n=1 Tax=Formimonas warabiya TaxID=1761012 RepID=A0A3G1KTY1_FORW1|nr:Cof-type HAD-IIB family hydrolase [Candidatus Formimonas warabiya]ATW25912.1 hypothetical protein DCMF_15025 [Candidatus Formimonas warabiya]